MTELHPLNPAATATLFMRLETPSGPRTIVTSDLSVRDASLVAHVLNAAGQYAIVHEEIAPCSMRGMMAKHQQRLARERLKVVPAVDSITAFKRPRK